MALAEELFWDDRLPRGGKNSAQVFSQVSTWGGKNIRQVNLGFRVGGRIQEMRVEEGDAVNAGGPCRAP